MTVGIVLVIVWGPNLGTGGLKGNDLGPSNGSLRKICIRVRRLANFLAQISNGTLHGPLGITAWGTCLEKVLGQVKNTMDALTHEMDTRVLALVVYGLEFLVERDKESPHRFDFADRERTFVGETHGHDQFTVIPPVRQRQNTVEESWSQSVEPDLPFGGFETAGDLLGDVSYSATKTSRVIRGCFDDILSMVLSNVALENRPGPGGYIIRFITIEFSAPQVCEELGEIQTGVMH